MNKIPIFTGMTRVSAVHQLSWTFPNSRDRPIKLFPETTQPFPIGREKPEHGGFQFIEKNSKGDFHPSNPNINYSDQFSLPWSKL